MPPSKNATLRYIILDNLFRSPKKNDYTITELHTAVNEKLRQWDDKISKNQLLDDLWEMQILFDAPIVKEKNQVKGRNSYYWRYSNRAFSIFKPRLKGNELQILQDTIEMLRKFRGGPMNGWIEEIIANLEFRFGIVGNSDNLVSFDQNPLLQGLPFLSDIIDATMKHVPIDVSYRTNLGNEKNGIIHPYYVKQFKNRWFLFGLQDEDGKLVNRALDRIKKIKKVKKKFKPNNSVDFDHYFDQVVGVSVPYEEEGKQPIEIRLKFSPYRFPYILSKPMHRTQKVEDEANGIVSICVIPTRELETLILSYGSDVEVLSPDSFRSKITKIVSKMVDKYQPCE